MRHEDVGGVRLVEEREEELIEGIAKWPHPKDTPQLQRGGGACHRSKRGKGQRRKMPN